MQYEPTHRRQEATFGQRRRRRVFYWIQCLAALRSAGSGEPGVVFEGTHASFIGCGAVTSSNIRATARAEFFVTSIRSGAFTIPVRIAAFWATAAGPSEEFFAANKRSFLALLRHFLGSPYEHYVCNIRHKTSSQVVVQCSKSVIFEFVESAILSTQEARSKDFGVVESSWWRLMLILET